MKRQLPVVDIDGTPFYVDVLRDELRQKDKPENRISFNVFDQEGDGYTFLLDRETKNVPKNKSAIKELGDRYRWVTLSALMELDPEGIALRYDIPLSVLCPERAMRNFFDEDDDEAYGDGVYG